MLLKWKINIHVWVRKQGKLLTPQFSSEPKTNLKMNL